MTYDWQGTIAAAGLGLNSNSTSAAPAEIHKSTSNPALRSARVITSAVSASSSTSNNFTAVAIIMPTFSGAPLFARAAER